MSLYRIARAAQGDLDGIWCHIGSFDMRTTDHWLDLVERISQPLKSRPAAVRHL